MAVLPRPANLSWAKEQGVQEWPFQKVVGSTVERCVSSWVYKTAQTLPGRDRGVQLGPSKHTFGLHRCSWKGWPHFQSYVHASVLPYNLVRPRPTPVVVLLWLTVLPCGSDSGRGLRRTGVFWPVRPRSLVLALDRAGSSRSVSSLRYKKWFRFNRLQFWEPRFPDGH